MTSGSCCHSLEYPEDALVIGGVHELNIKIGDEITIPVKKFTIHENYDDFTIQNDICVIKLKLNFDFELSARKPLTVSRVMDLKLLPNPII